MPLLWHRFASHFRSENHTSAQSSTFRLSRFRVLGQILGGAKRSYLLQVIPMTTPEVAMTSSGPPVVHADSTLVSTVAPAKAAKLLRFTLGVSDQFAGPFL